MRTVTRGVVLAALATSFVAPPAQGSPPPVDGPRGRICAYAASSDPSPGSGDDTMVGQVNAGPLVWHTDFWVHCDVRVGTNSHNGSVPAAHVQASSSPHDGDAATGEVAVAAAPVSYPSSQGAQDYLCTSVSWPTATGPNRLYWTHGHRGPDGISNTIDDTPAHWTADPGAACQGSAQFDERSPFSLVFGSVDQRLCSALVRAHHALDPDSSGPEPGDTLYVDAEGDVFIDDGDGIREADWEHDLWYDCPGYVNWGSGPPGDDGTPVIDTGGGPSPKLRSAILGYVAITMSPGDAQPTVTLAGELAVPALWDCTAPPYAAGQPFTVTCEPTELPEAGWECGLLHADVTTTSTAAVARTEIHCDSGTVPEARTATVFGTGGHSSQAGPGLWPGLVTQLRCTISNGAGGAPVPGFAAGCGDPGAARYE